MNASVILAGLEQHDLALLINRAVVGTFFAISGYHKLFNKGRHEEFVATLKACGVPFIPVTQWFVPTVEFLGGLAAIVGLLSPLAALGMLAILVVAIFTDGLNRIPLWHPINKADYVCDVLYLPESPYAVMLAILIAAGPGGISLDALLLRYI